MADPFTYSVELNFPEAIEGILSFSLSYDKLQSVLNFIIEALKRHENGLKFLTEKDQAMINFNTTILNLKAKQEDLEAKLNSAENKLEEKLNKGQNDLENKLKEALDEINKQIKEPAAETKSILNKIENQDKGIQSQDKYLKGINNDIRDMENQAEKLEKRVKELERDVDDLFKNLGNGQNKSEGGKASASSKNYPKKNQNIKNNKGNQKVIKPKQEISSKGRNYDENPYKDAREAEQDSERRYANKSGQDLTGKGEILSGENQGKNNSSRKYEDQEENPGESAQSKSARGNLPRQNLDSQYQSSENAPYNAQNYPSASNSHGLNSYPENEFSGENARPQERKNLRQSESPENITFEDLPQGTKKRQYPGHKHSEEPEEESYEEQGSREPKTDRRRARELSENSVERDAENNRNPNIRVYKEKGSKQGAGDSSREEGGPEEGVSRGKTKSKGRRNEEEEEEEESDGEKDAKNPSRFRGQEDPEVASSKEIKYLKKNPEKGNRNIYPSTGISGEATDENPESQESSVKYRGNQGKNLNKADAKRRTDRDKEEGINSSQEGQEEYLDPNYKRNTKNSNKGMRRDPELNREVFDRDEDNLYRNQSENVPTDRPSLRNISERPSGRQKAYRSQQENPYQSREEESFGDQADPSNLESHSNTRPTKNIGKKSNREAENYQEDPEEGSSDPRNFENERRQNRPQRGEFYNAEEENPADENSQYQRNKDSRRQGDEYYPNRQIKNPDRVFDENKGEFTDNYKSGNRNQRNPDEFAGDNPQNFARNSKKNARDQEIPEGEEFSDKKYRDYGDQDMQGEALGNSRRDKEYPEGESTRKPRRDQENLEGDFSNGERGLRKGQDNIEEDASQGGRKYGRGNPEDYSHEEPARSYRRGQENSEDFSHEEPARSYRRGQDNPEDFPQEEPARSYRRGQDHPEDFSQGESSRNNRRNQENLEDFSQGGLTRNRRNQENPEDYSGESAANYRKGQDNPEDYSRAPTTSYRRGQDSPEGFSQGEPSRRGERGLENLQENLSQEEHPRNSQGNQEDPEGDFSHSGNTKKPRRPNKDKELTFKRDQDSQEYSGDLNADTERGYGNPNQRGSRTERLARQARNPEENLNAKNSSKDISDRKYNQRDLESQENEEEFSEGELENNSRKNRKNYGNRPENYEENEDLSGEEESKENQGKRENAASNRKNKDQKYKNPDYQGSQTGRANEEYEENSQDLETDRKDYPEGTKKPLTLKLKGQEDRRKQQGDISDKEGTSYEGINEGSSLEKAAYPNRKNLGSEQAGSLKNAAKGSEANKKSNLKSQEENKRNLSSKKDGKDTSDKNRENAYSAGRNSSSKEPTQSNRGNNIPKYQGARTERMIGDNSPSPRHRATRQAKHADETPYFNTKNISGDSEEKYNIEEDEEEGVGKDNRKANKGIKNLNEKDSDRRINYSTNQPISYNRQTNSKNRDEGQGRSNIKKQAKEQESDINSGNYRKKNESDTGTNQRENARDYSQDRNQYKGENRQNAQDRSQNKSDNRQSSQNRNLSQGVTENQDREYFHENPQQNKNQVSPNTIPPNPSTTIIYNKPANAPQIDINAIKNLERKVGDIDLILSNFSHLSPEAIEEILIKLKRLEQKLNQKIDKSEIDDLAKKLEELSNEFGNINILFQKYESKDAAPEPPKTKTTDTSALNALNRKLLILEETVKRFQLPTGVDLFQLWNDIKKIWDAIKDLQNLLQKISTNMQEKLEHVEKKLDRKIDENALKALEEKFFKALQEAIDSLMGKFADKHDTRKALKYIETIIRTTKQDEVVEKREGDDAMFARKPLGGWSCASCEKALENLTGKIGPFHPWNKLPLRDPADRIARVGPGFSRMLSTLPNEGSKTLRLDHVRSISPLGYATEYEAITPEPVILPKLSERSATPGPR